MWPPLRNVSTARHHPASLPWRTYGSERRDHSVSVIRIAEGTSYGDNIEGVADLRDIDGNRDG